MTDPNISPLARRLAEENNVDWRRLAGTGADGKVVERDVLDYLARVMAGDEALDPTPEPLPDGMEAWPDAPPSTDEPGASGGSDPFEETSVEAGDGGVFGIPDEDPSAPDEAGIPAARGSERHEVIGDVGADADEGVAAEAPAEADADLAAGVDADVEPDGPEVEADADAVPSTDDDLTDTIDEDIFLFEDETSADAAVAGGDADAPDDDEFDFGDLGPLRDTSEDAIDPVLSGEFEVPESALNDAPDLFAAGASEVDDDLDDMGDGLLVGDENVATSATDEGAIDAEAEPPEPAPDAAFGSIGAVDAAGANDDPAEKRSAMDGLELDETGDDAGEADRFALRLEDDDEPAAEPTAEPATDASIDRSAWAMDDDATPEQTDGASHDADDSRPEEGIDDEFVFGEAGQASDADAAPGRGGPEFDFEDADEFGGIYVGESERDGSETPDPAQADLGSDSVQFGAGGLEHASSEFVAADAAQPEVEGPDADAVAADAADGATAAMHADAEADADFVEDTDAVADLDAGDVAPELDLAALPLTTHGTLLRRHLDMTELADAQIALAHELGEDAPVPPGVFLVRAAAKALRTEALGGGDRVAWAQVDGGLRVRPIDGAAEVPFRTLIRAVYESDGGSSEPASPALIVVDLSSHDVDEAVLHLEAPVLALGRVLYDTHAGRSRTTLSLSGDVAADAGARLLGRVAELLDAPVRLVL